MVGDVKVDGGWGILARDRWREHIAESCRNGYWSPSRAGSGPRAGLWVRGAVIGVGGRVPVDGGPEAGHRWDGQITGGDVGVADHIAVLVEPGDLLTQRDHD